MSLTLRDSGLASVCRSRRCVAFVFVLALVVVTYPAWLYYLVYVAEPGFLHEEVRILFPYHRYTDSTLFQGNYILAFLDRSAHVWGYDAIVWVWARLFGDIRTLHLIVLPLALTLIYLLGVFFSARQMGGTAVGWGAVALSILQSNVLYQMASALPHAFAFPLLAWTLDALQRDSSVGLFVLTVSAALLYPPMTPIIGVAYAYFLLITPAKWRSARGERPMARRIAVLAAAAVASAAIVISGLPPKNDEFGSYMAPGTRTEEFPENGPGGRHFRGTLEPVAYGLLAFTQQFKPLASEDFLTPGTHAGLVVTLSVLLLGLGVAALLMPARSIAVARLKPFLSSSLFLAVVMVAAAPGLAYRFIFYPLHLLFSVLFPLGVASLLDRVGTSRFLRLAGMALVLAACSALMNTRYPGAMGPFAMKLTPEQQALIAYAERTPPNTLFAGRPGYTIEFVPFLAKRPAFLLGKTHYPAYEGYAKEMRARMLATIEAYFATDSRRVQQLRDRWGVDLLVVDRQTFTAAREPDFKFSPITKPFEEYVHQLLERRAGEAFYLESPPDEAVAYRSGAYYVLDLAALGPAMPQATRKP